MRSRTFSMLAALEVAPPSTMTFDVDLTPEEQAHASRTVELVDRMSRELVGHREVLALALGPNTLVSLHEPGEIAARFRAFGELENAALMKEAAPAGTTRIVLVCQAVVRVLALRSFDLAPGGDA